MTRFLHQVETNAVREPCDNESADCKRLIIVGEDNPLSSDPRYALYNRPANCAGERLQRVILNLPGDEYLAIWRVNLCSGPWDGREAGTRALKLLREDCEWHSMILLGAKVRRVFKTVINLAAPFELGVVDSPLCPTPMRVLSLPHPSGRCREWNEPGATTTARERERDGEETHAESQMEEFVTLLNAGQFWTFLRERERIRLRRLHGRQPPWTEDEILQKYSFTNVKRIHDRTTTLLWRDFYEQHQEPHPSPMTLINAAIFRYHGTIETARAVGWHDYWAQGSVSNSRDRLAQKTALRMSMGYRVFTSAYIVPNCGDTRAKTEVVADIVDGIASVASSIVSTDYWEMACDKLSDCHGVGSFMAKEVLLDYILATDWMPRDWTTWTPVGPGARRGANAVKTGVIRGIDESEALEVCRELHAQSAWEWPERQMICCRYDHDEDGNCHVHREGLPGIRLDLTDIQFQLCEFAKYEKARTGVGRPKGNFRPTIDDVTKETR